MLKIDPKYVRAVESATSGLDLYEALQKAIQLEHATIPPYLVAAYSLKPGENSAVRRTLIDIAREEMLHMAIAANVLNALGGRPIIGGPDFIPLYPAKLPMSIGAGLVVGLEPCSIALIRSIFMTIEAPEFPLQFPTAAEVEIEFSTIGAFYRAVIVKLGELGESAFIGNPDRQVILGAGFPTDRLFQINSVATATKALNWVVEDGEGTNTRPLDASEELAHYYRFAEIVQGRKLIPDASVPEGYSYGGAAIEFDATRVFDIPDNPKASDYVAGTFARGLIDEFNVAYTQVLADLQLTFDGHPSNIRQSNQSMVQLRSMAEDTMSFIDPATGRSVGISFEYTPPVIA
jgi:Ferritin-like